MSDSHHDSASDSESAQNIESLDLTATPCGICGPSTCDEEMIGCDGCEKWFHSRCVGLTGEKKPAKWFCKDDDCQQKAAQYKQAKRIKKGSGANSKPGTSSLADRMKALEEKEKQQQLELEAELRLQQKERRVERALERRKIELELELRAEEEEEERALQEDILRMKKEQINRIKTSQSSFEKQVADMDRELKKLSAIKSSKMAPKSEPKPADDGQKGTKSKEGLKKSTVAEDETSDEDDDDDYDGDCESQPSEKPGRSKLVRSTPLAAKKKKDANVSHNTSVAKQTGPTKTQMAARRGLTHKLRKFSGNPADWPLFFSSYTISTEACGYMDHENLIRLQECLEGNALELVSGQLLLPESVPRVMERLRRHFGRPEQILQSLVDKVKELESPHDLESFVPFANKVAQLCEHIEASGLQEHLTNPLLIKSLVAKIPYPEKRDWVHYRRAYGGDKPTLRTLTDWLMEFDEDACDADVNIDFLAKAQPKQQSKPDAKSSSQAGKGKTNQKGAVYLHSESSASVSSVGSSEPTKLKPCKVCQSTDHRLRFCDDFQKLTYDDRLKLVTREKLCKVCLNGHGGECKFRIHCNVGECREKHNPLMHPEGNVVGLSAHIQTNSTVMFRMLPVQLHCGDKSVTVLAFLDEGSSVTLLERKLADRLGVVGVQEHLTIKWTADHSREEKESRRMNLWTSGVGAAAGKLLLHSARTVEKLMLPRQTLDFKELAAQYSYLRELPIESYSGQPELLIGLNNIHSFAPIEVKMGSPVEPVAARCNLGWTVYGPKHPITFAAANYLGFHQEVSSGCELLDNDCTPGRLVEVAPQKRAEEERQLPTVEKSPALRDEPAVNALNTGRTAHGRGQDAVQNSTKHKPVDERWKRWNGWRQKVHIVCNPRSYLGNCEIVGVGAIHQSALSEHRLSQRQQREIGCRLEENHIRKSTSVSRSTTTNCWYQRSGEPVVTSQTSAQLRRTTAGTETERPTESPAVNVDWRASVEREQRPVVRLQRRRRRDRDAVQESPLKQTCESDRNA